MERRKGGLIGQVRREIRLRQYSSRTEKAYVWWIKQFVRFNDFRHPSEMGQAEATEFLSNLATDRKVSAATQNQALSALLFLYRRVLGQNLGWLDGMVRAKRRTRLPVVLAPEEVKAVLRQMKGTPRLIAALLYGTGMRLGEVLALRVKDLDFQRREIRVCSPKGARDRVRHPDSPGVAGPQGRAHDDDLHACFESRRTWCSQPDRQILRATGGSG